VLFVVTLPLLGWLLVGVSGPAAPTPAEQADPAVAIHADRPTAPAAPPMRTVETSLGHRGTLSASLDRLSVPPQLRQPLLETVEESIDLRRLNPRTGLLVQIDERERWRTLSIRSKPGRFLRIEITDDDGTPALRSTWVELPIRRETRTTSGIVESSVAQAISDSPHAITLVTGFADIFQWDVDLLVEPRTGDRVRIVYEVHSLGRTPADLPAYEGSPRDPGALLTVGRILAASYLGEMARASAFWVDGVDGEGDYYDVDGQPLRKTFLKSPLNYRRISSGFSRARRHPITRRVTPHHGIDYAAASGTPVVAAADGRIASAGWDGPLGKAVRIRHGSEYVTVYGHLRAIARGMRRGAEVKQNQVIGYVGSTGRATGPHLHYTMIQRGRPVDPRRIDNPSGRPLDPSRLPLLELVVRRHADQIDLDRVPSSAVARRDAGTSDRLVQ
jgi:murein DD-endopeptidase MepM/ murein hydrolase activator NlpD